MDSTFLDSLIREPSPQEKRLAKEFMVKQAMEHFDALPKNVRDLINYSDQRLSPFDYTPRVKRVDR